MYYYPSMCLNIVQFPHQDQKNALYFINEGFCQPTGSNGSQSVSDQLNGQQLNCLRNRQMLSLRTKRSREEEEDYDNSFRKLSSDSQISSHIDDRMEIDESSEVRTAKRVFYGSNKVGDESEKWPVFQHPEGGCVQVTPHGNVRVFREEGVEVSVRESGWW